ncbi:MAG: hypothetical protein K6C11_04115, partial [Bacilli bacterium]|nr:hypothetical protein [Bacilli bacterium]
MAKNKVVGFSCPTTNYYFELCNALNNDEKIYEVLHDVKKRKNQKTYKEILDNYKLFDSLGIKLNKVNVTDCSMFNDQEYTKEECTSKKEPSTIPVCLIDTERMRKNYNPTFNELEMTVVKDPRGVEDELSFISLSLDKKSTGIAGSYYNSAMVLTQFDIVKFDINPFDIQTLQVFFELLTASQNGNYDTVYAVRLNEMGRLLSEQIRLNRVFNIEETKVGSKEIDSQLKAINLF